MWNPSTNPAGHRADARECLEHYNQVMGYAVEMTPLLERRLLRAIYNGLLPAVINDACSWVARSDFHCGYNDDGKKYDSLQWILDKPDRLREQAESWKRICESRRVNMQAGAGRDLQF